MTDKELVRKLKTDPQTGLAAVIDRYTAYLLKIARIKLDGLCTDEDIEEAVSDVFFIFYKKGQQCGFDIRSVRAYLSLIAERHFTDVFRRQIKRPDDIPIDDLSETLPDRQSGEENTAVAEAIKKLGEPDTSIFMRKYFFGQKTADIAKELHLRPKTVDKRISRGLVRLKKLIEEEK
ncbi:MAG: sigma-70 family RNA polymerase sigma factor [Ruminococcus sp.]|nr:sigma-70 family RNA polymerase sigma factor [Ruminococcus sp.]